jgi:hypothetical protein
MAEGEVIDAEYEVRDDQGEHQEALVIIPTMAESVAKAESMTQVDVAKRYPRSVAKFKKDLETLATSSREIAGKCFYTLPARKGAESAKPISGPSIRMAEMMASSWGHLAMRCWHVATDDRSVTVAARVWDMQSNVAHQEEFVAPIVGSARYGSKRYGDDMIATTIRAAMKKALRNAILAVVPKAYYEELKSKIMQVAAGNIKDLKGSVVLAVKAWHEKFGVTEAQILKCLKRDAVDDVNAEDLIFLRGFWTAVTEGEAKVEEIFPPATTKAQDIADRLAKRDEKPPEEKPPEAAEEKPAAPAEPPAEKKAKK